MELARSRDRGRNQEVHLTDDEYDDFSDLLRAITLERHKIKEAMGFALDNAEASKDIVQVLVESLTLKETPAHKVAGAGKRDLAQATSRAAHSRPL